MEVEYMNSIKSRYGITKINGGSISYIKGLLNPINEQSDHWIYRTDHRAYNCKLLKFNFGFCYRPATGGSMNPVRTLGPAIAANNYKGIWIYFTAPFLGALCGAGVYSAIKLPEEDEDALKQPSAAASFRRWIIQNKSWWFSLRKLQLAPSCCNVCIVDGRNVNYKRMRTISRMGDNLSTVDWKVIHLC